MKNNQVYKLLNLNLISRFLPGLLLVLFLFGSWNSVLNLYISLTEGGYKIYQFQFSPDKNYSYKVNLVYVAVLDELLNIGLLFCGIYFFNYLLDQKIKVTNILIQQVINNQLSFEDLVLLRGYFQTNPVMFEQQLKLVNARLELRAV
jgi:hypothetical protein